IKEGDSLMKLEGKVALVTGSGRGIGKATALLFAREGADIAVNDIIEASAEQTAEEVRKMGRKAIAIKADIGEPAEVDMMVERIIKELGGVHILVNNAGLTDEGAPTQESSVNFWDKVMKVNLRGTYLCCRRAAQWMVSNKTGKIVNIGSIAGLGGFAPRPSYAPSKAAVIHLTHCLAVEWGKYNINVNCICPGTVMTDMIRDYVKRGIVNLERREKRTPLGRLQQPEHIAKAALFLVSDDASEITGATLAVDGGWSSYGME
ncbi:SDR family NAD(P)-dependent oxidoreductase, partial [Chloroflexota bacterium]